MIPTLLAFALTAQAKPPGLQLTEGRPRHYAVTLGLDPAADHFSASMDLELSLERPTRLLWLNATDLQVSAASLVVGGVSRPVHTVAGDKQSLGFAWEGKVKGEATLHVDYTGLVSPLETQGVFSQREGEDHYLFSQFEATDARKAFPCFDQPDLKATWQLTLRVPEKLGAFSNTSPVRETPMADGRREVVFAATPLLPSYLVAFAVGPFDVVEAGVAGRNQVPVRVLTPRGRAGDAAWAVSTTGPLLDELERWFDRPYPFSKLDVVSLPLPVGWGAMENPGLITIQQGWVVARVDVDNPGRQREYVETMAHELAHQWFGDFVTPAWWDDIWLNESFASWLGTRTVEALYPDWHMDTHRVSSQGYAVGADSLTTARQIREPIRTMDDIENAFDGITYAKGQAVLEMVEAWLGPEVFRRGVQHYLDLHPWGNATGADFVAAMADVASTNPTAVFGSFLDQPGVPLVRVALACEAGEQPGLRLTQERYLPSGPPDKTRWRVPVCYRYPADGEVQRSCTVLSARKAELPLRGQACPGWVVANDGQRGYYRVGYSEADFGVLLRGTEASLSVPERVGVLLDGSALAARGELPTGVLLDALPELLALGERPLTSATVGLVAGLDAHLVPPDLRPNYQRFIQKTYGPLAAGLGLDARPDDTDELRLLRTDVLRLVGDLGQDPEIVATATSLADRWLTDRSGVSPELVPVVLAIAGQRGDLAWFERLRVEVERESDRERRSLLLAAMGSIRDPEALTAALDYATSGGIDFREAAGALFSALGQEDTRQTLWTYTTGHLDRLEAVVPSFARGYLPYLGSGFCDAGHHAEVESLFSSRVKAWIGGARTLAQVLEGIADCEATKAASAPGVRAFLERW